MTTPTLPAPQVPVHRPEWLTDQTWPFPIAALDVEGHHVAYSDSGGDGPVLLFCHVGLWSLLWRDVMIDLSRDHRCVTFDTPGVGLSSTLGPRDQTMTTSVRAVGALIDTLDLRGITLVLHDLGGLAGLAASNDRLDKIAGLVAINWFAWRPRGFLLPVSLRLFGSAPVRGLDALTGGLARGSSTRFGVGRHLSKPTRLAWRRGLQQRSARRVAHRLFADAARNRSVQRDAEAALAALSDRPILTVFGQFGDYLRFQRQWLERRPDLIRVVVKWGLHFPMCDNPGLVANEVRAWLPHAVAPPTGRTRPATG